MRGIKSLSQIISKFPLRFLLLSFLVGVFFWGGFNWSMELSNTESFCISCHEMQDNVYQEYKKSIHYKNSTGVRATCPDCHVPKEWSQKLARKIQASNELYHWMIGSINDRKKFLQKRSVLADHVWSSMEKNDSRECRHCHDETAMKYEIQSTKAKKIHTLNRDWGMTCIQCHQGVAHNLPDNFDKEVIIDGWHQRIEKQKIACHECHENMPTPASQEEW